MISDRGCNRCAGPQRLQMILGEVRESRSERVRPEPLLLAGGFRGLRLRVNSLSNIPRATLELFLAPPQGS